MRSPNHGFPKTPRTLRKNDVTMLKEPGILAGSNFRERQARGAGRRSIGEAATVRIFTPTWSLELLEPDVFDRLLKATKSWSSDRESGLRRT
jgi:hypothetical protein